MLRARRRRRGDDGASAVEFALVLPILLMLVFGIITMGVLFAQKLALSNSARQASRLGVVGNHTCQDILNEAVNAGGTISMSYTSTPSKFRFQADLLNSDGSVAKTTCAESTGLTANTPTAQPCQNSTAGQELRVYARWDSTSWIPGVFASKTLRLEGTGTFQCEFS